MNIQFEHFSRQSTSILCACLSFQRNVLNPYYIREIALVKTQYIPSNAWNVLSALNEVLNTWFLLVYLHKYTKSVTECQEEKNILNIWNNIMSFKIHKNICNSSMEYSCANFHFALRIQVILNQFNKFWQNSFSFYTNVHKLTNCAREKLICARVMFFTWHAPCNSVVS